MAQIYTLLIAQFLACDSGLDWSEKARVTGTAPQQHVAIDRSSWLVVVSNGIINRAFGNPGELLGCHCCRNRVPRA